MKTSKDRYLTTHVGSMLRPPEIVDFNAKIAAGQPYDKAAYETALKQDVAEVVKNQANCGIDVVSDGEFGKPGWLYVTNRMSGFEGRDVERPKVGFRGWDAEGRFHGGTVPFNWLFADGHVDSFLKDVKYKPGDPQPPPLPQPQPQPTPKQ